ncbi:hypothetical protein HNP84_005339 [Thermocatellispora tengchongensis]|uniref:General stress protein 17M-like domain-containing protein n=1 Tax=Thermocatellispora tengchongensis TaxID=1073253 RepID=A0A840PHR0_9ACTN|nr:general stress protein [Thermocatellispora tengchongensis]MBB5135595.1 hypothetical protein [Thermocatellispora tengchongensis]
MALLTPAPTAYAPGGTPGLGDRVVAGSYATYEQARRALDFLAGEGFPVAKAAIVGSDLRLVETVLARLTWPRAAGAGAAAGTWFGLAAGLLTALIASGPAPLLVLGGILYGALSGAAFGLGAYLVGRRRGGYVSRSALVADKYDIVTDRDVAEDAANLLIKHGWRSGTA